MQGETDLTVFGKVGARGVQERLENAQVDLEQGRAPEDALITPHQDERVKRDVVFRIGRDAVCTILMWPQGIHRHHTQPVVVNTTATKSVSYQKHDNTTWSATISMIMQLAHIQPVVVNTVIVS